MSKRLRFSVTLFMFLSIMAIAPPLWADEIVVEVLEGYPKPEVLNEGDVAEVKWKANKGNSTYQVEVGGDGASKNNGRTIEDGDYPSANAIKTSEVHFNDLAIEEGKEEFERAFSIYIWVTATIESDTGAQEEKDEKARFEIHVDTLPPNPPFNVEGSAGDQRIVVVWDEPDEEDQIEDYVVYFDTESRTNDEKYKYSVNVGRVNTYSLDHTPDGKRIKNGVTYYGKVSAIDKAGNEGDKSEGEFKATPFDVVGYPEIVGEEGGCASALGGKGSLDIIIVMFITVFILFGMRMSEKLEVRKNGWDGSDS